MARANLWLRTASRVLVRFGAFHARALGELERRASLLPWDKYLTPGRPVHLRVTSRKSRLYHQGAIAERIGNGIREVTGTSPESASGNDEASGDEQVVVVRVLRDECLVSLDSSGELLHRRGYRLATAKAPLRETLAAALLMASEWDGVHPLIDPFSGSGTIPIEAALLARKIPPGLSRQFGFQRWRGYEQAKWEVLVESARRGILAEAPGAILGSDRDSGAVTAARSNADRAGVMQDLTLQKASVSMLQSPGPVGWMVTNPPYGTRVGESQRLRDLYASLGNILRKNFPGWQLTMLVAAGGLERQTGIALRTVLETNNGGIGVRALSARGLRDSR
jgi:putative N6-adenine-specific DNA methylase